ncbi:MAG TPA: hypothetical protein VH024_17830 [Candidatus Angelobacter sp.]|jgi:hypothetical protein|nr:hypothetical protein [Candidatus Angelobacter sp.]
MTKKMFTRCLMSVLVLLGPAAGQQMAVGLGSPNTRDSMSYADAKVSLRSFEEANFIAVADRIICVLAPRGSIEAGIGEVHEQGKLGVSGAENSVVVKAPISLEEMRYAMALLGRYAHQKFVIAFVPQDAGASRTKPAEMVLLRVPQKTSRAQMEQVLDTSGVPYRTLLDEHRMLVFLPEGTSDAAVQKAAHRLGAKIEAERGIGEIVGDDDRGKASAAYDRIIAEYESAHPDKPLSSKLWSREWRDAESRTCTTAK